MAGVNPSHWATNTELDDPEFRAEWFAYLRRLAGAASVGLFTLVLCLWLGTVLGWL